MSKEYYTLKKILFGLKNEYLKITAELKELERFLLLKENNIEKIHIFLTKSYSKNEIQLMCFLYETKNRLEKTIIQIMTNLGMYPNQKISNIKEHDNNYIIEEFPELIDKKYSKEFTQKVIEILNEEFTQNVTDIYSGTGYESIPFLSMSTSSIYASEANNISIEFTPHKDSYLHIGSYKGFLSKEKIANVFDFTFPKKKFPEYYQRIIETSPNMDKEIDIIGNFNYSKKATLEIIEEPKKLILKKK